MNARKASVFSGAEMAWSVRNFLRRFDLERGGWVVLGVGFFSEGVVDVGGG